MDTETRPPKNLWIDKMDTSNALKCMLENQGAAFEADRLALNDIELVVDKIYNHLCQFQQGRIIFCGGMLFGAGGMDSFSKERFAKEIRDHLKED